MTIGFSLEATPPFRLDLTAWALRARLAEVIGLEVRHDKDGKEEL
jgi:hypothetical protein